MNPLSMLAARAAARLGDRIHHTSPADLAAQGLTVTTGPDGRRTVRRLDLPAIAERHRAAVLARGLDDIDRALLDPATRRALAATVARLDTQTRAATRDKAGRCPTCGDDDITTFAAFTADGRGYGACDTCGATWRTQVAPVVRLARTRPAGARFPLDEAA